MRILIVDDEPMQRDMLRGFLDAQGYETDMAGDGDEALIRLREHPADLLLLDYKMPGKDGVATLAEAKALDPLVRAVMITAHGDVDTAVAAMRNGADDFLEKPVDLKRLLAQIERLERQREVEADAALALAAMEKNGSRTTEGLPPEDDDPLPVNLVGSSRAMKEAISLAVRVAPTPWAVLLRGETGTGKELFARLLHHLSPAGSGPFVEVNCGAIPENLFESELFGHERGAFTGASARRKGRFELADGGTLLLDEVGELPLSLQPKLLRALQENRVQRVGGDREIPVTVRVVAATHRDLRRMVAEGLFREDLFYRLNVFELTIPPLRERREDIPELAAYFLKRYAARPLDLDPEAVRMLARYRFPGNVRELEHVLQRAATLTRGRVIRPQDLPPEIRFHEASDSGSLPDRLDALERELIRHALDTANGVQTRAAESLGISERTLRYKLKKHRIVFHPDN